MFVLNTNAKYTLKTNKINNILWKKYTTTFLKLFSNVKYLYKSTEGYNKTCALSPNWKRSSINRVNRVNQ